MTFVGKILVIVIMVFALFFLAVSTVVFATHRDWRAEVTKKQTQISELQKKQSDAEKRAGDAAAALQAAKDAHDQQVKTLESRIADLERDNTTKQTQWSEQNNLLATAEQTTKTSIDEAAARKQETDKLRDSLSEVQKLNNEFKFTETTLRQNIAELTRQLDSAVATNKNLRESVALLSGRLREIGVSDDVNQMRAVSNRVPPRVEGVVLTVSPRNDRVEISIGSDDGLVTGHELELYRMNPTPEYLGRIKIESTDPDQAVGKVIGQTVQGKKIVEGDIVSSEIRPRS
jgi:cell division protein FtsL